MNMLTVQKIQNVYLINALTDSVFLTMKKPIVHCDSIYRGGQKSYMYCGKTFRDVCKNDDECSSKKCYNHENCLMQTSGPSDSEGVKGIIPASFVMIIALLAILCICCCCRNRKNIDRS